MGWKIYDEAVQLLQQRHGYFPRIFRWRGQRFEVESVIRCWTRVGRRHGLSIERRFFHLRCTAGEFEIYQDIVVGTWHLRRARLGQARTLAIGQVQPAWR